MLPAQNQTSALATGQWGKSKLTFFELIMLLKSHYITGNNHDIALPSSFASASRAVPSYLLSHFIPACFISCMESYWRLWALQCASMHAGYVSVSHILQGLMIDHLNQVCWKRETSKTCRVPYTTRIEKILWEDQY